MKECLETESLPQLISVGNTHSIVLNSKSKVFGFGWNDNGQCGQPFNNQILPFKSKANIVHIENPHPEYTVRIKQVLKHSE